MTKLVSPNTPPDTKRKLESYVELPEIAERLWRLVQQQIIICPSSAAHRDESLASKDRDDLQRLYEMLAGDLRFKYYTEIANLQLLECFDAYRANTEPRFDFAPSLAIEAKVAAFADLYRLDGWIPSASFTLPLSEIKPIFSEPVAILRQRGVTGIGEIFEGWKEDEQTFREFFDEETSDYGPAILKSLARLSALDPGSDEYQEILFGAAASIGLLMASAMSKGVQQQDAAAQVRQFLLCPIIKRIPSAELSGILWAGLACQAKDGRKKPLSPGMLTDVSVISALMPYCTAMFLDSECWDLMHIGPAKKYVGKYTTKLFCKKNAQDFLAYLTKLGSESPAAHTSLAKQVYGEPEPLDLYHSRQLRVRVKTDYTAEWN